ncbi:MAG: cohesin domain-containing protein [bacterium]
MKNKIILFIVYLSLLSLLMGIGICGAASLTVCNNTASASTENVTVSVDFTTEEGENVAAIQLDIGYDAENLSFKEVSAGQAALDADKQVSYSTPSAGLIRIVSFGLNQNTFAEGTIATISFDIPFTASAGVVDLTLSNVTASDIEAEMIAVSIVAGSITILEGPDSLPPTVSNVSPVPDAKQVPVNSDISFNIQDSGEGVDIESIQLTLNDQEIPVEDLEISGDEADYTVIYNPPADFNYGSVITVSIDGQDLQSPPSVMSTYTWSFTTGSESDTIPPVISDIESQPSISSVIITWYTDEAATSRVEYGSTIAYGSFTPLDSSLITEHSVTITGLDSETTYYFRVNSQDASGNEAVSGNDTFITQASDHISDQEDPDGEDDSDIDSQESDDSDADGNNDSSNVHIGNDDIVNDEDNDSIDYLQDELITSLGGCFINKAGGY